MAKGYSRLTFNDRKRLEKLYKSGMTVSEAAKELQVSVSTVSRELRRVENEYNAVQAQAIANIHKGSRDKGQQKRSTATKQKIYECMVIEPELNCAQVAKKIGMPYPTVWSYYGSIKKQMEEENKMEEKETVLW